MAHTDFNAVGRRKKAVARVRLVPGKGDILINKRVMDDFTSTRGWRTGIFRVSMLK